MSPATLSVVIAARNCADRIEGTVVPWKNLATEIIVADQMSTDGTAELGERLGCRVIRNDPPGGNFDLNRKLAMQQARGDWVLYIDTDERPTPELLAEVREFLAMGVGPNSPDGVRIPNLFYFLGKPLRRGIFNPRSAEIRMVRREGLWSYPCEEGFHRGVSVRGQIKRFKSSYKHFNVNSLSEWFLKTNQYTEYDAQKQAARFLAMQDRKAAASGRLKTYEAFGEALAFFIKHYFLKRGFLDGFHGLVAVFYFMLYHLTLRVKIWEAVSRADLTLEKDYLRPLEQPKR